MHSAVSCAIPGAKRPEQVEDNVAAAAMPPLSKETMERIRGIYDHHVRPEVHHLW
jgi:aryl-alcohol dehydrogenase-like predicted oxidoreductase